MSKIHEGQEECMQDLGELLNIVNMHTHRGLCEENNHFTTKNAN